MVGARGGRARPRRVLREAVPMTADQDSARALPTLLGVMFVNLVGFGIVVPLLPFYAKSFQAPAWQMALIFSAYAAGAFFGEPFWGRISDRVGRKPILISTVTGNCLCYFALAFAPNIWVAFAVRFLGGMASGNGSVIQGYIADVTPPEARAGRMSMLSAAYNLGFIVGPALGGLLAHPSAGHAGFRLPLIVAASLAGFCALGIALVVKESRARHRHIFDRQASRWAVAGRAFTHPVIARLMAVMFLAGSAFMGIEFVFALWSQARFGWGTREVGLAFAVTGIVSTLAQVLITGPASQRFGEARVLAWGMVLTTFAIAAMPFSSGMGIIVLLCFSAFGQSIAGPNISALISRNADAQNQGQYLGLNNAVGALARLVGPFFAGIAFSGVGVDAPFYLAGLLVLPAIFLALRARR
ncbi:MAG TPA: MFS transporter [Rhizomicrobium sp.]|nr:MFS transporter [Rhizomicrobium sp.]